MLLRGRNTVGYTPYPQAVTDAFVHEAAATGIDIFRIFDALNDVSQMRPAIDAVRATGTAVAEVARHLDPERRGPDDGDGLDGVEQLVELHRLADVLDVVQALEVRAGHVGLLPDEAGADDELVEPLVLVARRDGAAVEVDVLQAQVTY